LFEVLTLLYLGCITLIITLFAYRKLIKVFVLLMQIRQVGLINLLPGCIINLLLKRSIFDILMDIWYLPSTSKYIKLILKSAFYGIPPDQAIKLFDDLEPEVRVFFFTQV
jgi:hypothetical protein